MTVSLYDGLEKILITYALTVLGHLDGDARGRGSLADTTFTADEDPAEGVLINQVLKGGREFGLFCFNHDSILFFCLLNADPHTGFWGFGVLGFWV